MRKYAKYVKRAKELGATGAKVVPTKSVVTAEWVRMKCQFGCGGYGGRLTCPPNSPPPDTTRKILDEYRNGILIHVTEEEAEVREIIVTLETEIFFDGYYKAWSMGAGPCDVCDKCGKKCRYPADARPSMESCGIDVFATARANGLPIEVLDSRECGHDYYGIVLIE